MTHYIIYNRTNKCYVAKLGSQTSFTRSIFRARKYSSLDAARADCCGNESVLRMPYQDELNYQRR